MVKEELKIILVCIIAILIILLLATFMGAASILAYNPPSGEPIEFEYDYSSEGEYDKIVIDNNFISYTFFDGVCNDRAALVQAPCYKQANLRTVNGTLSQAEKNELAALAQNSGFFNLADIEGESSTDQRYYSYVIRAKIGGKVKEVEYRSSLRSEPMPEAFKSLRNKLLEIAKNKVTKT